MRTHLFALVFGAILSVSVTGLPNGQSPKVLVTRDAPDNVNDGQFNNCLRPNDHRFSRGEVSY